jgi:hypothetical protein
MVGFFSFRLNCKEMHGTKNISVFPKYPSLQFVTGTVLHFALLHPRFPSYALQAMLRRRFNPPVKHKPDTKNFRFAAFLSPLLKWLNKSFVYVHESVHRDRIV